MLWSSLHYNHTPFELSRQHKITWWARVWHMCSSCSCCFHAQKQLDFPVWWGWTRLEWIFSGWSRRWCFWLAEVSCFLKAGSCLKTNILNRTLVWWIIGTGYLAVFTDRRGWWWCGGTRSYSWVHNRGPVWKGQSTNHRFLIPTCVVLNPQPLNKKHTHLRSCVQHCPSYTLNYEWLSHFLQLSPCVYLWLNENNAEQPPASYRILRETLNCACACEWICMCVCVKHGNRGTVTRLKNTTALFCCTV